MIICKPQNVELKQKDIEKNAKVDILKKCREFGACYVIDGGNGQNDIAEIRNIDSYDEFLGYACGNNQAGLFYINMESAPKKKKKGLIVDSKEEGDQNDGLEGLECQPMRLDSKLAFAIEGGLGWKINQLRDNILVELAKANQSTILQTGGGIWMLNILLEGKHFDYKRQMVLMDNTGKFTLCKNHTNNYTHSGSVYCIYGVNTKPVASYLPDFLHIGAGSD